MRLDDRAHWDAHQPEWTTKMTEQTLQQLLVERVTAYSQSDRPRELLDAGIDKMFKDVVDDLCRSYGDLAKQIKEAIGAALPADVGNVFELQRYNALIASQLRQRWESAALESVVLQQANKSIDEILSADGVIAKEVSLRALLEEFVEAHKEQAASEQWERPEVRFEESESYGSTTLFICFDPEPESSYRSGGYGRNSRSDYSLKHRLHIRLTDEVRKGPERWDPEVRVGEVFSAQLDDKKVCLDMQIYSKWERMLASLYFGSAKILVDCEADEISYGLYD